MNDPRLLTLLTLVKVKNYTKTAQRLFITQPAVTHHIKSIEKEFDIVIFANSKAFELTPQGVIMVEYARRMINQSTQLSSDLEKSMLPTKPLTIGISFSSSFYLGNQELLQVLLAKNPSIAIEVQSLKTIFSSLEVGKLDYAIIDSAYNDDLFEGVVLNSLTLVPVCYREGKFKEIKRVTREMLKNNPIIVGQPEEGLHSATMQALKAANINVSNHSPIFSNSCFVMSQLIEQQDGIGFMYQEYLPHFPNLKKMDLSNFSMTQNIVLVYNQNSFDKVQLSILLKELKKCKGKVL